MGLVFLSLSVRKLDLCGLCAFGCRYCSSNAGNYLRINRRRFADQTEEQLGQCIYPADDPALMFRWPGVLESLEAQLARMQERWGAGQTIVYSMLTDGFSPPLVRDGTTRAALELIVRHTSFRIRVLTKNAIVGSDEWLSFFAEHADRFVVGLSIGTLDRDWARRIEVGTSSPEARLRATAKLQEAGVPTYGMLCPVFPDVLEGDGLERLVDRLRPEVVEHVWAEPYNDRQNWKTVRDGYERGSRGRRWLNSVYRSRNTVAWSRYATNLYIRLRRKARAEGWLSKLRYLLYENLITEQHARRFAGLKGVLLQSKPGPDGLSRNPHIAALQRAARR